MDDPLTPAVSRRLAAYVQPLTLAQRHEVWDMLRAARTIADVDRWLTDRGG